MFFVDDRKFINEFIDSLAVPTHDASGFISNKFVNLSLRYL